MSFHVNFAPHGKQLDEAFQAVISDRDDTNWLIFAFDKGTYDLRVQATGDGGLEELNDEFSDGKVQFAYAKVIDPNTELPKFVFIGWCGSGVPELRKAFFNSQLNDVSKFFKSFHVQINARDEADVEPSLIMKRVAESSGANYSVHKETAKPQPRVEPVGSVYKKTEIPDIAAMQRESMKKENAPKPVGTNYTPIQTAPKKLGNRWNVALQNQDSGAMAVRAERERFEREVRERESQRAREILSNESHNEDEERLKAIKREQEEAERKEREAEEERRRHEAEEAAKIRQQEEQEALRLQEEEERRRRIQLEEEEKERARYQQQQQQEEAERKRQEEEAERKRQEEEMRKAEEEERRRRAREEEENQRRQQEEAERLERQRQEEAERLEHQKQEEAAALQSQMNEVTDRAIHASQTASAAAAVPNGQYEGLCAVVLFEYDAAEPNEMSLVEGEVISQIDQVDEGWWYGVGEDGKKQGLFPANYVQLLEEQPSLAPNESVSTSAPTSTQASTPLKQQSEQEEDKGNVAVALYDYEADEDNEISFVEGDVITHIEFVSDDWWQGLAADGKSVGLFPANYVELQQ
ncbi:uncharacterized protein BX663DRAFT_522154 [Cokeromyces recurvatus]|uniref:uncharacterized protein n=1 Tax=Cokeromyces recurvatus TaxID=90255 RepID=UPI002220E47D|nr:uncharacterized protein BX663DRAFT_522154 [Cokeromyces recurvatus]KAI7899309.1 hypothetical protein BX663DRAFT_522154 [Cokeromyces recurvatus]